jgi:RNase P subunit RPR2
MSMHYCQQGAVKPNVYVVTCKKCTRSIPAGAQEFPTGNLVVQCSLCGELRRYRPSEVYLGFPDSHLVQQQVSVTRRPKGEW